MPLLSETTIERNCQYKKTFGNFTKGTSNEYTCNKAKSRKCKIICCRTSTTFISKYHFAQFFPRGLISTEWHLWLQWVATSRKLSGPHGICRLGNTKELVSSNYPYSYSLSEFCTASQVKTFEDFIKLVYIFQ